MAAANVYISIPLRHAMESHAATLLLRGAGIHVSNPCELASTDTSLDELRTTIARTCYRLIDEASIVALYAGYYGRDCAAEVGYAIARCKPIIPFVLDGAINERLLMNDWMISAYTRPPCSNLSELVAAVERLTLSAGQDGRQVFATSPAPVK
jgi:nucleoside 2-deoxyribosyltransferase